MEFKNYTERARGFVQSAQMGALSAGHQQFKPEHLLKVLLDDREGLARNLIAAASGDGAKALKLTGDAAKQAGPLIEKLYKAFVEKDMSMLEINPLIVTADDHLRVLDAKLSFDGNSLFRHPDIKALRDELVVIGQDFDRNIRTDLRTVTVKSAAELDGKVLQLGKKTFRRLVAG